MARATPEQKAPKPAVTPSTPTLKRNRQPVVSDYNTRHRDKRVRISDPGPGRKAARNKNASGPNQATVYSPKSRSKAQQPESSSKGRRTIFDGVVLRRFFSSADKGKDKTDAVMSNGVTPEQKKVEERGDEEGDEQMDDGQLGDEVEQMGGEQMVDEQMGDEQKGDEERDASGMGDEQKGDEKGYASEMGDEQQGDEKGDANEMRKEQKGEEEGDVSESLVPEEVDHVLEGLDDSRVESSLASSNKGLLSVYQSQRLSHVSFRK